MNGFINSIVNKQQKVDLSKIPTDRLHEMIVNQKIRLGTINDGIDSLREKNKELEEEAQKLYREGDNNPEKREEIVYDLDFISESIADNNNEIQGLREAKRIATMYLQDLEHEMKIRNSMIYSLDAADQIFEIHKKQTMARELRRKKVTEQFGRNKIIWDVSKPQDVPDLTKEARLRWKKTDELRLFTPRSSAKTKTTEDVPTHN